MDTRIVSIGVYQKRSSAKNTLVNRNPHQHFVASRVLPDPIWVLGIDHGLSADAIGAPANLLEDSRPQAILKL